MANLNIIQDLLKALEAGSYNAAPGTLTQGAALQVEDLSPVMYNVCWDDQHIKLQRVLKSKSCKSTLAQFNRQLSYGQFGATAGLEGAIGQEDTGDFVRITVPMCFYSQVRRTTIVADMVETVDGQKASERQASDAAKVIAGDIEFDLFRGKDDFSNGGVFDGNPLAIPVLPNMLGLGVQIRQSDAQRNTQDLMFAEYGSDESVVMSGGGVLTQAMIENAQVRSQMNQGTAEKLYLDPKALSAYNQLVYGKERIVLAGSPQTATGGDLQTQWASGATVKLEASRFLSGKTAPAAPRSNGPTAPTLTSVVSTTVAGVRTPFLLNEVYTYFVTSASELGESPRTAATAVTVAVLGDVLRLTITHPVAGVVRYFNLYRTDAGGSIVKGPGAPGARFIGKVMITAGSATTVVDDLGNKSPGFVTGYLIQSDTAEIKELAPYSRLKLAVTDLSTPEAHFRFCTLAVYQPRKNVLIDNLRGAF